MKTHQLLGGLALIALALPAGAGDGRIEINQASVDAAGGFPYTISSPASYLLTSDLVVPADTDALVLDSSEVVIDLNGFAIRGPFSCTLSACALDTGRGVRPWLSVAFGRDTTLRNGRVSGFGDTCVALNSAAFVTELVVSNCGRNGVSVSSGSIVTSNRVLFTGEHGILMAGTTHPPTFERNAVSLSGLGVGSFVAVSGGRASGGNSCDDGSCSARGLRRYYVTTAFHNGDTALGACATGYRMASLFEILNPSSLEYDTRLGCVHAGGSTPPTGGGGTAWIRSGFVSQPPVPNCLLWTTASENEMGYVANFGATLTTPRTLSPFLVFEQQCDILFPVWCIED